MRLPPKRIDFVFVRDPFGWDEGAGFVESCEIALMGSCLACMQAIAAERQRT